MKKGFTLIELLAVIVILAIIALIATPIVLNIINNVKENAQLRSAEMYLRGVEQAIMRENMNASTSFDPTSCTIISGNLKCGKKDVEVDVDGEKPTGGTIKFEDGKIMEVDLSFGPDVTIIKNAEGQLVYASSIAKICTSINPIVQPICNESLYVMESVIVGSKATKDTMYNKGTIYSCDVGATSDTQGVIFYVLDSNDDTVSLIMDRNIASSVAWNSSNGTEPTTAETALATATSDWNISPRLPKYIEIKDGSNWLLTNLQHPEFGDGSTDYIYWTSTLCESPECRDGYIESEVLAWTISGLGYKTGYLVSEMYPIGVRAVITIPKESLSL